MAALAAVTVALSMRVVGILLVAALMVLPVTTATRVAWSMGSAFVLSLAIGLGSALVGLRSRTTPISRREGRSCSSRLARSWWPPSPGRYAAADVLRVAIPGSWQSRQRASYCSAAPTTTVSPE